MTLTDTRIRTAKPREKPYKLSDGQGLHLEVRPNGSKLWRLRYRLCGKESVYAIGEYPLTSLAEARQERDAARKLIRQGLNPSHQRKLSRIRAGHQHANTFKAVAEEWLARNSSHWTPKSLKQRKRVLERDVFPSIGDLPIGQVTPAHVLSIVKRIEARAPTMAVLANQAIGAVSRHAISTLRAENDPTQPIRGSIKTRKTEHHRPLSRDEIPTFLSAIDDFSGSFPTKAALRLAFFTLARSVEILGAKWSEFDLDAALWRIPAERMKMREEHIVPLPSQAVQLIESLRPISGNSDYLFPHRSNLRKHVSRGVLWKAVDSMGFSGQFSPHGIRATGSTILNEMGFRPEIIERQLAHSERNKVRASYNRAEYLPERKKMMQSWADLLGQLEAGESKVVPIRSGSDRARD